MKGKKRGNKMIENGNLAKVQEILGCRFENVILLRQALTHSSFSNEKRLKRFSNNERLEFLGDAVLEVVTSEYVYREHMDMDEGSLTKLRASIVCESTLAFCARSLQLGEYIYLGKGEEATGGRERDSILSDTLEAVIGAIYLDGGFTNAKEFISRVVLADMEHKKLFFDSKTILQELVQNKFKKKLTYKLLEETGPDHNKKFTVVAKMGKTEMMQGVGRTKKAAEQAAAYHSILMLRKTEDGKKKDS